MHGDEYYEDLYRETPGEGKQHGIAIIICLVLFIIAYYIG